MGLSSLSAASLALLAPAGTLLHLTAPDCGLSAVMSAVLAALHAGTFEGGGYCDGWGLQTRRATP